MSFGASPSATTGRRGGRRQLGSRDVAIQSCGALLVVRESDLVVVQASENASLFLGDPETVVGRALADLGGNLCDGVRANLGKSLDGVPAALRCRVGPARRECDVLLHRPSSGGLLIELEPAGPAVDMSERIANALAPVLSAPTLDRLCEDAARVFQTMTGYDRVLVFRFDEAGPAQVVAERRKAGIASCLGQHFGDSEAPPNAHLFSERCRIRHLVDAREVPVAVRPIRYPSAELPLDLSAATWRSFSPLHLELLERMGVRGALVASILVGGRLWGLIVCHHRAPRFVHYQVRAACELLAETVATRVAALEALAQAEAEAEARGLESAMIESISRHGDWKPALLAESSPLRRVVSSEGGALAYEGRLFTWGGAPSDARLRELVEWLDSRRGEGVIAISLQQGRASGVSVLDSGMLDVLAVPLSSGEGEYLIWLRPVAPEAVRLPREVLHPAGGIMHPAAPIFQGDLRPSVSASGRSVAWSQADRLTARAIGKSVSDVIEQFRSVRVLIAQAQLAQAKAQVGLSDQPILIADNEGRVLLTTAAWNALPGLRECALTVLQDLAGLCAESGHVERHLLELLTRYQAWRGRVTLPGDGACPKSYLIRADAVLSRPDEALGFVIILTDCAEQMAAQSAGSRLRARFPRESEGSAPADVGEASGAYAELLSVVADNARRAARELAEATDPTQSVALCDGVDVSASRTLELLRRLIAYSGQEDQARQDSGAG